MLKIKKMVHMSEKAVASIALKVGVASSNSVCRILNYQNKVPESMKQFKK